MKLTPGEGSRSGLSDIKGLILIRGLYVGFDVFVLFIHLIYI
jgi:hypothetical protein